MADGIANHSVHSRAARESVRAIKMFHFVQGNLAGGGRRGDRRVSQRASLAQGEDSRGRPASPMGTATKFLRVMRQTQEPHAVRGMLPAFPAAIFTASTPP